MKSNHPRVGKFLKQLITSLSITVLLSSNVFAAANDPLTEIQKSLADLQNQITALSSQLTAQTTTLNTAGSNLSTQLTTSTTTLTGKIAGSTSTLTGKVADSTATLTGKVADSTATLTERIAELGNASDSSGVDLIERIEALQSSSNNIMAELETDYIGVSTTLCFDAGASVGRSVGAHVEIGAGWPLIVNASATLGTDGGISGEVGLSNQVCIEVPLYDVVSNELYVQFDTEKFDALVATIAGPAQNTIPLMADLYTTKIVPASEDAIGTMQEVIAGVKAKRPFNEIMAENMPPAITDVMETAGEAFNSLSDPCDVIESTPLGTAFNMSDKFDNELSFICDASIDPIGGVTDAVTGITGTIDDTLVIAVSEIKDTVGEIKSTVGDVKTAVNSVKSTVDTTIISSLTTINNAVQPIKDAIDGICNDSILKAAC